LLIDEQKLNQQEKEEQALRVSYNNHFSTSQKDGRERGRKTNINNSIFSHQNFKDNQSPNSQIKGK